MADKLYRYTILLSILLIGLNISGYFHPSALNWGFHFLGFLPGYASVIYALLALAIIMASFKVDFEKMLRPVAEVMVRRPYLFISLSALVFISAALLLQVKASVLGDSFTLIKNFREYQSGVSYLAPWHEPLSIYFLYYFTLAIGPLGYPAIANSFLIIDIFLGIGFLAVTMMIARNLGFDPVPKLLIFLFLAILPYMLFFIGYIEVYSFSTLLLAIFTFLSVMVIRKRMPYHFLVPLWILLTFSHYINGALIFSVIYLGRREYLDGRVNEVKKSIFAGLALILLFFVLANFEIERLINVSPVSHILSLTDQISMVNRYSQSYTLLSSYHFLEIFNFLVIMSPFAILLVAYLSWRHKRKIMTIDPLNLWLVTAFLPVAVYYFFAKLEQGNASDWDAFAAQFYLVNLFASVVFFQFTSGKNIRTYAVIVLVTLLNSGIWFWVNAREESSLERFQSLWDKRVLSHLGNYTHALRLYRYYEAENDTARAIEVWGKYSKLYPDDPRGFRNELDAAIRFRAGDLERQIGVYTRWLSLESENDSVRHGFIKLLMDKGNLLFGSGDHDSSLLYYQRVLLLDTVNVNALNNMGSVYAERGELDKAIGLFTRVIGLDSSNRNANANLGNAYIDKGLKNKGEYYLKRANQIPDKR